MSGCASAWQRMAESQQTMVFVAKAIQSTHARTHTHTRTLTHTLSLTRAHMYKESPSPQLTCTFCVDMIFGASTMLFSTPRSPTPGASTSTVWQVRGRNEEIRAATLTKRNSHDPPPFPFPFPPPSFILQALTHRLHSSNLCITQLCCSPWSREGTRAGGSGASRGARRDNTRGETAP